MTTRIRALLAGSVATLALALVACSTGTAATITPSATPAVTASASALPAASAGPSVGAALIPDGTYVTAPIPIADSLAKVKADKTITAAQRADIVQQFSGHTSQTFKIELQQGSWTQYETYDGGGFEVGSRASFVFPDAHTVLIQEQCCGVSTFTVTKNGSSFSLRFITEAHTSAEDNLLGQIVFESAPFTLVP